MKTEKEFNELISSGNVRFKTIEELKAEGWFLLGGFWEHNDYSVSIHQDPMENLSGREFDYNSFRVFDELDSTFKYMTPEYSLTWIPEDFLVVTDCNIGRVSIDFPSIDEMLGLL